MILVVIFFTFIASVAMVFAGNLLVTDVLEVNRKRRIQEFEQELLKRNKQKARAAAATSQQKTLGSLAAQAISEANAEKSTFTEKLQLFIDQSGTGITVKTLALASAITFSVIVAPAIYLMDDVLLGLLIGLIGIPLPLLWIQIKRKQRFEALSSQLSDSLELMSRVLRAGQTINQAMFAVGQEFKPPIATEFLYCYEQQNLGISTDIALRDLAKRTGLLEIKIFVLALIIHRQSGGNLTELLDKLAGIIRERYKMRGKVKALTAEGRLQAAILLGLPPAMYCRLLVISRDYALELLSHTNLIIGCLVSMTFGALWIRKIVNFDF